MRRLGRVPVVLDEELRVYLLPLDLLGLLLVRRHHLEVLTVTLRPKAIGTEGDDGGRTNGTLHVVDEVAVGIGNIQTIEPEAQIIVEEDLVIGTEIETLTEAGISVMEEVEARLTETIEDHLRERGTEGYRHMGQERRIGIAPTTVGSGILEIDGLRHSMIANGKGKGILKGTESVNETGNAAEIGIGEIETNEIERETESGQSVKETESGIGTEIEIGSGNVSGLRLVGLVGLSLYPRDLQIGRGLLQACEIFTKYSLLSRKWTERGKNANESPSTIAVVFPHPIHRLDQQIFGPLRRLYLRHLLHRFNMLVSQQPRRPLLACLLPTLLPTLQDSLGPEMAKILIKRR